MTTFSHLILHPSYPESFEACAHQTKSIKITSKAALNDGINEPNKLTDKFNIESMLILHDYGSYLRRM
jgi:hypothetical protein